MAEASDHYMRDEPAVPGVRQRFNSLIDRVRDDYSVQTSRIKAFEKQTSFQADELRLIHERIVALERSHTSSKEQYEREIRSLRQQIASTQAPPETSNTSLADLDIDQLPSSMKRLGDDWSVVYNPDIVRTIDIDLVRSIPQTSIPCCVVFSPTGETLAVGGHGEVNLYHAWRGDKIGHLRDEDMRTDPDDPDGPFVRCIGFSPDGKWIAAGFEDSVVRVWHAYTRTTHGRFKGHLEGVLSLVFTADSKAVISSSTDGTVRQWSLATTTATHTSKLGDGFASLALSPNGKFLAGGSFDKSVYILDLSTWKLASRMIQNNQDQGHTDSIYSVIFLPDGRGLATASLDGSIILWTLESHVLDTKADSQHPTHSAIDPKSSKLLGHKGFVLSLATVSRGRWLLSGSKDNTIQVWDARYGVPIALIRGHSNSVMTIASNPRSQHFATASGDKSVKIWSFQ